jgi:hypothetical protein
MPPVPKPRASHLSHNDENINEKHRSSTPPISEARARRLKQKTTPTKNDEIPESPSPVVTASREDKEKESSAINNSFIARIRENDTLARYKRDLSSPGPANQANGISCLF